jgi:hypothetical protein
MSLVPGVFPSQITPQGPFFEREKIMEKGNTDPDFYEKLDSFVEELIAGGIQRKAPAKNRFPSGEKERNMAGIEVKQENSEAAISSTGFYLYGTVTSFDEDPKKRLLLLEYPGPYQPNVTSTCPVYVPLSCKGLIYIEIGQNILVFGQVNDCRVGKTRVPRLIADRIFRDGNAKLEEAAK